jgi:hypothetical protein
MIATNWHLLKWTPTVLTVIGMVGVALLILSLGFFWRSGAQRPLLMNKAFFFTMSTIHLVALLALFWLYSANYYGVKDAIPGLIGGILPIGVPFFGALGAIVISLEGITKHFTDWQRKWAYWHMSRPLLGAVLGSVAFFIYILLAKAAGASAPDATTPVSELAVFFVVAFVVGYREETFRALIKAVIDLILTPANVVPLHAPAITFEVKGAQVINYSFPDGAAGSEQVVTVTVSNTGNATLTAPIALVSVTGSDALTFSKSNDLLSGTDLAPGLARTVDLTFRPANQGSFSGSLTVMSGGASIGSLGLTGRGA